MRAEHLVGLVPTITRDTSGIEAAVLLAEHRLPAVVIVDARGVPEAVIPGYQLLKIAVPAYVLEDPTLAHAYSEEDADELTATLRVCTVGTLISDQQLSTLRPPQVLPDDTVMEVAMAMLSGKFPMILCTDRTGTYLGTITLSRVLGALAGSESV